MCLICSKYRNECHNDQILGSRGGGLFCLGFSKWQQASALKFKKQNHNVSYLFFQKIYPELSTKTTFLRKEKG